MSRPVTKHERQLLRRQLRQRRQALTPAQQAAAAAQLTAQLLELPEIQQASTIAAYQAMPEELNPAPALQALAEQGKQLALPVLHPFARGHLLFLRYQPGQPLITNPLGIAEPPLRVPDIVPLGELDVVLLPLVGFDASGQRLGMGGGFYDRTLAGWARGAYPQLHPIGLAHSCQQLDQVPTASWDIPLPQIVTPERRWRFPTEPV